MTIYRLFRATITREVFVMVPRDADDDAEWRLADTLCAVDPNDPTPEEVRDCEEVRSVEVHEVGLIPIAEPHNTSTIQQLIDAGELDVKP